MNAPLFDHEKLHVYQVSIRFVAWAEPVIHSLPAKLSARDQLDRASTSIPLNIAEGNGKFTVPDRCRFFDSARGSGLECAACLDVLVAKGNIPQEQADEGKTILHEIVCMLIGLVRSQDNDRLREDAAGYGRNESEKD
jgi:four helix bundle protein